MRHCLMVSLAVSLKAIIPLSLWVLTTSYNLHSSLGVSRREIFFFTPYTVFRISIVLFIYVAVLGGCIKYILCCVFFCVDCPFSLKRYLLSKCFNLWNCGPKFIRWTFLPLSTFEDVSIKQSSKNEPWTL